MVDAERALPPQEVRDRVTLGLSSAGHFFNHYFEPAFFVAALYMPVALGVPYEDVLPLIFVGRLLFGFLAPVAGWLGDRWSMTGMMLIYYAGLGVAGIAVGFSQTPMQVAVSLGFLGAAASIYHPVGIAWLSKSSRNRGRNMGINGAFGNLGPGIAGVMTGVLIDLFSWRLAFIVPGIVVLATGAVFYLALRRGLIVDQHDHAAETAAAQGKTHRVYLVMLVTVLITGIIFTGTQATLPKLFEEKFADLVFLGSEKGSASVIGLSIMSVYVVAGGFQIVAGWLSDRFSMKFVYLGTMVVQVPALVAVVLLSGLPLIAVAMIMVSANTGAQAPENNLIARYTPIRWRSTMFGLKFILSFGVASAAIPFAAELRARGESFDLLYFFMAALAAVMVFAVAFLPNDHGAKESA